MGPILGGGCGPALGPLCSGPHIPGGGGPPIRGGGPPIGGGPLGGPPIPVSKDNWSICKINTLSKFAEAKEGHKTHH